jgi:hypothetical protein
VHTENAHLYNLYLLASIFRGKDAPVWKIARIVECQKVRALQWTYLSRVSLEHALFRPRMRVTRTRAHFPLVAFGDTQASLWLTLESSFQDFLHLEYQARWRSGSFWAGCNIAIMPWFFLQIRAILATNGLNSAWVRSLQSRQTI